MIHVRVGAAPESDPYWEDSLAFVRMASGAELESISGWNRVSARLFAIDAAMVVYRSNLARLAELDRQVICSGLNEAAHLSIEGRDAELGHIQHQFESKLGHSWSERSRGTWLACMNALLPSPFRAAQATVESAYITASQDGDTVAANLADRLVMRLKEAQSTLTPTKLVTSA